MGAGIDIWHHLTIKEVGTPSLQLPIEGLTSVFFSLWQVAIDKFRGF